MLNEYAGKSPVSNYAIDSLQGYNENSLTLSPNNRGIRIVRYVDDTEYTIN